MKWLFLFYLNLYVFVVNAQEAVTLNVIQDSIANQLGLFPQEKIHLHTDRNRYVPGEKIWFKAYVVDAFSHQSPTYSQYAYVELINPSDSLVHRVMVSRDEHGLFHGNIFLSDFIPEGDYTLRAYTRYMENLGDGYFFKKPVRINNIKAANQQVRKQPVVKNDYEVSFFPEGGYLTEGVTCKVAFKALNSSGASESVTVEVVDRDGNRMAEVSSGYGGTGSFSMTPEAGAAYYFNCRNQNGLEKRFRLPDAQKTYSIAAGYRNKNHLVEVKKSQGLPEIPLYLLVHCRGQVLYFAPWDYSNTHITFPCNRFPSGVLQLLLLDGQLNPVSERLIFNKNEDQARLVFSTDKPSYPKRDNVSSAIYVTDPDGKPLAGHVSVAVTDDRDVEADINNTILSGLLLSSELRGYIESPGYYLLDDANAALALDLLMMTHGWRRYNIPEVISGKYVLPETGYEVTKTISGTVTGVLLGRPVANGEVLLASSDGGFAQVETDSAGFFSFEADYPDSVKFHVQAKNQKGGAGVELVLNQEKFPLLKHVPKSPPLPFSDTTKDVQQSVDASDFVKKAEQRAQYDDDMRLTQLPEVVVRAKMIEKKDEARLASSMYNLSSDVTIYREDVERRTPVRIADWFYTVAGVFITPEGNVLIRQLPSNRSKPPLILLDGMPFDGELKDINVFDVETIDIFKGPSAAIFGSQGSGGAISVTTKRALSYTPQANSSKNFASYTPLSYQQPIEFYSPKYDTSELKFLGTPDFRSTIFWKPDLLLSDDGKASFDFYTSDFPTTYSVVIEGITDDGRIIRQVEKIEVK